MTSKQNQFPPTKKLSLTDLFMCRDSRKTLAKSTIALDLTQIDIRSTFVTKIARETKLIKSWSV